MLSSAWCYFCFLCSLLAAAVFLGSLLAAAAVFLALFFISSVVVCVPLNVPTDFSGYF